MNARTFDNLTRTIAGRMSRRRALATGGLGIAGAVFGRNAGVAFGQSATPGSDATPVTATSIDVLYVQTFSKATIQQDANDPSAFTITLVGSTGQTVYFSDRPEHIVGTLTDEAFVDGRAFDPSDPPNAAIVTISGGGEQILVVELTEPAYDAATGTVSYAARELQGQPEGDALASLAARQTGVDLGDSVGPVTLFIDQLTCAPLNAPCTQNSDCCSGDCCPFTTCINRTCE